MSETVARGANGGKWVRVLRSQELVQSIIDLIDERGLRAGDPLPPEPKLMEEFDAARNSVREALRTLQALGIVEIRHGYGTFVGSASMTAMRPSLLFRTRAQSVRGLEDLLEVRQILETQLANKISARPGQPLLDELDACVERMRDPHRSAEADRRFHELICTAAGNELALELIRLFWDVYRQTESQLGAPASTPEGLVDKHKAIVTALRGEGAMTVEEAVARHFDEVRLRIEAVTP
ncbi:MAG TPA: FadR/GntR family transcriptional regulator [Pseudonocardiaceae bacterium]|nr:FadR/GntR family transcriptional regulator [Pseudonocardiaceae bacterium]